MASNSSPPARGRRAGGTPAPPAGRAEGPAPHPGGARAGGPAGGTGGRSTASAPVTSLIYGRNAVREALRGRRKVRRVLLAAGGVGDELEPRVAEWGAAGGGRTVVQRLPALELAAIVGSPDHQGVVAEVDPHPYLELASVLRSHSLLIALDAVQDPHNLGAIIRTAEAAGAAVIFPRHRAAEVTAAVVKASAGATEHAAVARVRNLADALAEAKAAGFWIYGAAADAQSPYASQDFRYPTCFVVGSEGEGVGRRVAGMCDVMISLPLTGKMESLNVSVSAGILLYEALRQRSVAVRP